MVRLVRIEIGGADGHQDVPLRPVPTATWYEMQPQDVSGGPSASGRRVSGKDAVCPSRVSREQDTSMRKSITRGGTRPRPAKGSAVGEGMQGIGASAGRRARADSEGQKGVASSSVAPQLQTARLQRDKPHRWPSSLQRIALWPRRRSSSGRATGSGVVWERRILAQIHEAPGRPPTESLNIARRFLP